MTGEDVQNINEEERESIKRRKLEQRFGGLSGNGFPDASAFTRQQPVQQTTKSSPASAAVVSVAPKNVVVQQQVKKKIDLVESSSAKFTCDANDVLEFSVARGKNFGRTRAHLKDDEEEKIQNEDDDDLNFEPEFTHQVFREDETIYGYTDLSIKVELTANFLDRYVSVEYAEKVRSSLNPADDVTARLHKWFPECSTSESREEFMKILEKTDQEEIPQGGGKVVEEWEDDGTDVSYSVRMFDFSDERVRKWHDNVEPFVAFYIDAASKIDKENDRRWLWFVLIAHEKSTGRWATAGFTTVYQFYAHPFKRRLRISQVLVLPPYQRKGFGAKLLDSVRLYAQNSRRGINGEKISPANYDDDKNNNKSAAQESILLLKQSRVQDITVEDPTDQLQRLRDVRDCIVASEHTEIIKAVKVAAMNAIVATQAPAAASATTTTTIGAENVTALKEERLKNARAAFELPKDVFENYFREDLKICEPQAKRVWEALLFVWAKQCKAPQEGTVADAFRNNVLSRLKKKHMASLGKEDDVGNKRIRETADGFTMTKGGGDGQRVEIEIASNNQHQTSNAYKNNAVDTDDDDAPKDPAEALAELFHECMQNLSYLSTVFKIP